jgi:hypothetical protein
MVMAPRGRPRRRGRIWFALGVGVVVVALMLRWWLKWR